MIKEVSYKGISSVPSDFLCPDGDNAMLMNLVPEDGAIKPILPPETVMVLPNEKRVVYIRTVHNDKHYIIHDAKTNTIEWTTDGKTFVELLRLEDAEMYEVKGIGNTIIALTNKGMEYLLWKGEQGYIYLGDKFPELSLSFGLQGEIRRSEKFIVKFKSLIKIGSVNENGKDYWYYEPFKDEEKKNVASQTLGKVNKFISENSTNSGKFIYPFLVRYAYRLYDGTLIYHSAPVLMICNTECAPAVIVDSMSPGLPAGVDAASCRVVGVVHSLDYAVNEASELDELKKWNDIVKSVDIFISKPIYTYNQNGECDGLYDYDRSISNELGYCLAKMSNEDTTSGYKKYNLGGMYRFAFEPNDPKVKTKAFIKLPSKSKEAVVKEVQNCANFYLLKSIDLDNMKTERTVIDIDKDYLQSLVNREQMTDDYDSHDTLIPQYAFIYNARLNIANISKKLFGGFDPATMFAYCKDYSKNLPVDAYATVYIKQDGKDIAVISKVGTIGYNSPMLYFYYPNTNAYKAIISLKRTGETAFKFQLKKHDFLNGAFFFGGWGNPGMTAPDPNEDDERLRHDNKIAEPLKPATAITLDATVELKNKIYTSEINNPFYFPLLGVNTVGNGEIKGICSAVKALSEGQFGQFPLYAFTSEGVWALELSKEGTYIARQPVTRDVCINPKSITQIDTAVLFATSRGIMMLQGAETECVSDILYGDNTLPVKQLAKYDELVGLSGLVSESLNIIPFKDYVKDCRMLYDYEHQRIIVYNPSSENKYSYVLSLKSKQWGMSEQNIIYSVNSYPDAMAALANNRLVNFSKEEDALTDNVLITRPMTLGEVNVFKTVNGVIQRGFFRKGRVRSVLYGSNDLFHWFVVWSSRDHYLRGFSGSPYKYHRIALLCTLQGDESLLGCSVDYRERINNQIR